MNILLHTQFPPSVGGIETVAALLSRAWQRRGHQVEILASNDSAPLRPVFPELAKVHYRPGPLTILKALKRADVFVHMNVSLSGVWPLALIRRPWIAVHHGFYVRHGRRDWRERLKLKLASRAAANIAVSQAVADSLPVRCQVIPNPYDDSVFHPVASEAEGGGFNVAFVGRLVSDKGAELLLKAVALLVRQRIEPAPKLSIIGDGPEMERLQRLTRELALAGSVQFLGELAQGSIAEELRRHRIMVVPSRAEAFGIVALEGAGCGCAVLAARTGGLLEAAGAGGVFFEPGEVEDLASKLGFLLTHPEHVSEQRVGMGEHLARHAPEIVAERYLVAIGQALK